MKLMKIVVAFLALTTAGCNTGTNKTTGNPAHEDVKIFLVSYSPDLELFAETDPFVAGQSGNILAHFTHLSGFKPIDNSQVTLRLKVGNEEVTRVIEKPLRKGIYSTDIIPTVPGYGKIVFEINDPSGSTETMESPVTIYPDEETAHTAAEDSEPPVTNTIIFTKEQSWKVDFSTDLPVMQPFGQVIRTTPV